MWSLIKGLFTLVCLGFLAYAVFFVPIGGAPVATHVREVWSSATIQAKVEQLKAGVREELATKMQSARDLEQKTRGRGKKEELTEADRKGLDKLLGESAKAH